METVFIRTSYYASYEKAFELEHFNKEKLIQRTPTLEPWSFQTALSSSASHLFASSNL